MIIVEGPKGAGKSTLANQLSVNLGLPVVQPFSGHRGRGDNLLAKVQQDLHGWPDPKNGGTKIYDGHPLIDEYIYGPMHRQRISDGFSGHHIRPLLDFFWDQSVIIYCRPPEPHVEGPDVQLYDFVLRYPLTGAHVFLYDYTQPHSYGRVESHARAHWVQRENIVLPGRRY
jgi:hypothetical protein